MKKLILLIIAGFLIISCEKQEIGLRSEITKSDILGSWTDVSSLPDGFTGADASFKGAIYTFFSDNTYKTENESLLGVVNGGTWIFDNEAKTVSFVESVDSEIDLENYKIDKNWIITSFDDVNLEVQYRMYREKSVIINPFTTEVIDTIDAINISLYRKFRKMQ